MTLKNHPLAGLCYVLSEAFYHLHGKRFGVFPVRARYYGRTHWWLETPAGRVIDFTKEQFSKPYPYHKGRRGGFLTKEPSARARAVMAILQRAEYRDHIARCFRVPRKLLSL